MSKEQTVSDIIQEVTVEICDEYCKWTGMYGDDEEAMLNEKCDDCPLNRL